MERQNLHASESVRRSETWWNEMAHVSSFWLQWGMACSVFALVFAWVFALVFAQDSSWDCSDRDDILRDAPVDVSTPSRCTLDCTARTYRAVLELHNRLTIRFTDSRAGEIRYMFKSFLIFCLNLSMAQLSLLLFKRFSCLLSLFYSSRLCINFQQQKVHIKEKRFVVISRQ